MGEVPATLGGCWHSHKLVPRAVNSPKLYCPESEQLILDQGAAGRPAPDVIVFRVFSMSNGIADCIESRVSAEVVRSAVQVIGPGFHRKAEDPPRAVSEFGIHTVLL